MSTPDLSARRPLWLGGIALAMLLGGFGGWAVLTTIAGAIIAHGQVEVEQNRQVVQHPDGGVVAEVLVAEGDLVAEDQLLIRLDSADLSSELTIVEGQLFELMARTARLEAERDGAETLRLSPELLAAAEDPAVAALIEGQRQLFRARATSRAAEAEQLDKRREQIAAQVAGIDAQIAALGTQLDLIGQELTDQQGLLDKGLTQSSRVLSLRREEARLSGTIGELTASRAEAEGRITEIGLQILRLGSSLREEAITRLRDLEYNRLELAERRAALRARLARLDIRAPVAGVVLGQVVTTPRAVIRAAEPVLYLVPQDRPLVIAAQVLPIHVDQVHVGQAVMLRFSALDTRFTPELEGEVTKVSADAFTDERTQASYYRAEVRLKPGETDKLGGQPVLPGMPVETYLRTQDRSPLAYLVKPLTEYFTRAFREG